MFDPEYLYEVSDEQTEETNGLDIIFLGLIIKYMKDVLISDLENYKLRKQKAVKIFSEELRVKINKFNKKLTIANKKIFEEAITTSLAPEIEMLGEAAKIEKIPEKAPIPLKDNEAVKNKIDLGYKKTNVTMRNYTKTTVDAVNSDFIDKLDEAFLKMQSATANLDDVMFDTLKDLAQKGVFKVTYTSANGRKRVEYADVALRRALVTGLNQTYAEATELYAEQTGHDLAQVSQHQGAREGEGINNHKSWQGKIYSLKGNTEKYPNIRIKTGYGQGAGLCGWNCRHSFRIFIEGITQPFKPLIEKPPITYKGKTYTFYQATQKQRELERKIRESKREYYLCRQTNQSTKDVAKRINQLTNEVAQFSELIGNPRRKGSERVVTKF